MCTQTYTHSNIGGQYGAREPMALMVAFASVLILCVSSQQGQHLYKRVRLGTLYQMHLEWHICNLSTWNTEAEGW